MDKKKVEKKQVVDKNGYVVLVNGDQEIRVRKNRIQPWLDNGYKEK